MHADDVLRDGVRGEVEETQRQVSGSEGRRNILAYIHTVRSFQSLTSNHSKSRRVSSSLRRTETTCRYIYQTPTCVCCGMFRKLLSRDPMPTNLLGAVAPGVEYARVTEEEQKKTSVHAQRQPALQHFKALVTFWEICIFTFFTQT